MPRRVACWRAGRCARPRSRSSNPKSCSITSVFVGGEAHLRAWGIGAQGTIPPSTASRSGVSLPSMSRNWTGGRKRELHVGDRATRPLRARACVVTAAPPMASTPCSDSHRVPQADDGAHQVVAPNAWLTMALPASTMSAPGSLEQHRRVAEDLAAVEGDHERRLGAALRAWRPAGRACSTRRAGRWRHRCARSAGRSQGRRRGSRSEPRRQGRRRWRRRPSTHLRPVLTEVRPGIRRERTRTVRLPSRPRHSWWISSSHSTGQGAPHRCTVEGILLLVAERQAAVVEPDHHLVAPARHLHVDRRRRRVVEAPLVDGPAHRRGGGRQVTRLGRREPQVGGRRLHHRRRRCGRRGERPPRRGPRAVARRGAGAPSPGGGHRCLRPTASGALPPVDLTGGRTLRRRCSSSPFPARASDAAPWPVPSILAGRRPGATALGCLARSTVRSRWHR